MTASLFHRAERADFNLIRMSTKKLVDHTRFIPVRPIPADVNNAWLKRNSTATIAEILAARS